MRQKKIVVALLTVIILSISVAQMAEATPLNWFINLLQEDPIASVRVGGAYTYEKEDEIFIQSNESVKEFTPVSILGEELWKSEEEEIVLYKAKEIDLESGKTVGEKFYINESDVDVYEYVASVKEGGAQRYKLNYDNDEFDKKYDLIFEPNVHVGVIREKVSKKDGEVYAKVREFYTGESNWVKKSDLNVPRSLEGISKEKKKEEFGTIVNVDKTAIMRNDENENMRAKLFEYQTVKVLSDEDDGRVLISIDGVKGTVSSKFIKVHESNAIGKMKEVEHTVNIRSGPGVAYDVIGSKLSGSDVRVVDVIDGWYKIVIVDDVYGYVDPEYVEVKGEITNVRVAANVREYPHEKSEKIGAIQNGFKVTVIGKEIDGYVKVLHKGKEGYILADYVKI